MAQAILLTKKLSGGATETNLYTVANIVEAKPASGGGSTMIIAGLTGSINVTESPSQMEILANA